VRGKRPSPALGIYLTMCNDPEKQVADESDARLALEREIET
jgi:hypothetical protein